MTFGGGTHYHQQMNTDHMLGEIVPRTRDHDTTENSNRRQTAAAT